MGKGKRNTPAALYYFESAFQLKVGFPSTEAFEDKYLVDFNFHWAPTFTHVSFQVLFSTNAWTLPYEFSWLMVTITEERVIVEWSM